MKVKEIMSKDPVYCQPDTSLEEVARMMVECDCGEIPVVDGAEARRPLGVLTDRDIVVRVVAKGTNPLELSARGCMTSPAITVSPETDIEDCMDLMEEHQVRRIPVVDGSGALCGIVAQADIARRLGPRETAEVVREVSR